MVTVTWSAVQKLKALIVEHPDDPVVRLTLRDVDENRLAFSITLENAPRPDDEVQTIEGLTVAVEGKNAPRMDGIVLDYREPQGFKFLHPGQTEEFTLTLPNLN
ncbi:MAG: iron-sulfur cluster biosynthesis family protein [Nitrospirota bacterium]